MHGRALRRPHRTLVALLLSLAVLSGVGAMLAVWAERQVVSTPGWTDTSGRLIADHQVEPAIARYLVGQLFASTDVTGAVRAVLPGPAAALAGELIGRLRSSADHLAATLLATGPARAAWRAANREAQREFLAVLAGRSAVAHERGGYIVLDLHALLTRLATQVINATRLATGTGGLGAALIGTVEKAAANRLLANLSPSAGHLVIMRSGHRVLMEAAVQAIRTGAVVLPLAVLLLVVAALVLARGRRPAALARAGVYAVLIGGLMLLGRRLIAELVSSQVVTVDWARGAGASAWLIATSVLRDLALGVLAAGAVAAVTGAVLSSARRRGTPTSAPRSRPRARR